MALRYRLVTLADASNRRMAARWLFVLALAGFALTMFVLLATGRGAGNWFFVLTVWLALVFVPLWLLIQIFQTLGPTLRSRLAAGVAAREDRYRRPATATLLVEELFAREVVMPRIATPVQTAKAREAAAALVVRVARRPDMLEALRAGMVRCLAALDHWVQGISGWASVEAPENIQARWESVRSLAALTAVVRALLGVYEENAGPPAWPFLAGRSLHAYLEAAFDFCDDLALDVTVPTWDEAPLDVPADAVTTARVRAAWDAYVAAPGSAPAALQGFLTEAVPN